MFCPQCGTESSAELHYCRSCGANLKVIGKAVTLSEAIARSDSVPAKFKEMVKNLKVDKVTDEVSRAMDKMNREIVRSAQDPTPHKPWWLAGKKKTADQRRERYLTKGAIKLFGGGGLTIFLYFLAHALVLKLPPDVIAKIPFEIDPVVHVLWLFGLIPMLSGIGHILAGLSIRRGSARQLDESTLEIHSPGHYSGEDSVALPRGTPASVTERTTNILDRDPGRSPVEGS